MILKLRLVWETKKKQVVETFTVNECYERLDSQTLRILRLVSRFVSNQATKILFEELNLTNRSIEEVSEIFIAFSKEPLRCIPRKIKHHFYNMVPWQIMAGSELSNPYIHDPDKPKVMSDLTIFCRDWIELYFNIVNKLYNIIGPQLQAWEFQGPSRTQIHKDFCEYATKSGTPLKEINSWYTLIHFTLLASLKSPRIRISHLMLRDVSFWNVIATKPQEYRHGWYDNCPELKQMIKQYDNAGVWPVSDIRRLSLVMTDHSKTCRGLFYLRFGNRIYVKTEC